MAGKSSLPMDFPWKSRKRMEESKKMGENINDLFERGEPNPHGKYFTGKSHLKMLVEEPLAIGNVTFEPGCRNNWHIHHADRAGGQILLCTAGRGWYAEEGKEPRALGPGDVVTIPAGVKHWHGAAKDGWFAHVAVEVPGENARTEWLEPVDEAEYEKMEWETIRKGR